MESLENLLMEKFKPVILDENDAFDYFNLQLVVPNQVYTPSDDTDLSIVFLKKWIQNIDQSPYSLEKSQNIRIFEMGVGSGVLSLYLASRLLQKGYLPEIIGVDINPIAVQTAQFNAELNGLEKYITFYQGEFFSPLINHHNYAPFDFILSNPPYLASEPQIIDQKNRQLIDFAWEGGINGYEVTLAFLEEVSPFLKCPGDFMLISSSNIDQTPIKSHLKKLNIEILEVLSTHKFFEDILLYHGRRIRKIG